MQKKMRLLVILFFSISIIGCANSPKTMSELEQGKRYFNNGYYKRAFHELLPIATTGNADAQYAVGYMTYYGYGVPQDTDTGYFWIKKAADQNFEPAVRALNLMAKPAKKIERITVQEQ